MKRSHLVALCVMALLGVAAVAAPLLRSAEHSTLDDQTRAHAPGEFVSLTHGKTHYQIAGPPDSSTVVLVHGFAIPSFVWDPNFDVIAAQGIRVVRYDLWGRGYTDRPAAVYDGELFSEQLRELIDSLNLKTPVDLVGLAMGGAVVAQFAASNPALVRKVVLIDPLAEQTDIRALNLPLLGEFLTKTVIVPAMPNQMSEYLYNADHASALRQRFEEQMKYKGFARAILSTARHFNQEDHAPHYRALAGRKVLMISGAADAISALKQGGELRQWIEPEFLLVEQAGHLPHYERPEIVNPALVNFLKK